MSIASQITALHTDKTAIAAAIAAKGGSLSQNAGFDTFAADITNIPHAYGTVRFSSQSTRMTVTGLPFTPKVVLAYYSQAKANVVPDTSTWGFIGYNADTEYKFSGMAWPYGSTTPYTMWTKQGAALVITINPDGFEVSYNSYIFPAGSEYVWYACG